MSTEIAINARPSLVARMADRFGVDPDKLMGTLKATAFRQRDKDILISNEQMMALLIVSEQHGLNPFTKEIFAYPDKGAIVPVVSVDGWARVINDHPQYDGIEFRFSENITTPKGGKPCPEWCEAVIYRKDRNKPTIIREYIDEVFIEGRGPWISHTKRMLRHKTLIQGARVAFSFSGIYDEDEASRIIEGTATRVAEGRRITNAAGAPDLQKRLEDAAVINEGEQPQTVQADEASDDTFNPSASEIPNE